MALKKQRRGIVGVAIALALAVPGRALAEKWYFEPTFNARLGYDDNIRFTSRFTDSAFSAYAAAAARFGMRTEISEADLKLRLDTVHYDGHSDLNTSNQFLDMNLGYKAGLHTFRLKGAYYNDSTRTSELFTTGFLATNIPRTYRALNPTWAWQWSERAALELGYRYTDSSYDNKRRFGLIDYRYDTANLGASYQLTERTRLQGSLNASMYDAEKIFSEYNSYWLQLGVDHQLTETLNLYFSIGPRYTEFDFRGPLGLNVNTSDSTYLAEFRVRKKYETLSIEATLRSYENPSSSGRLLRTQAAEFSLSGKLSARTSYGLSTGFSRNTSTGGLEDASQDRDYVFFEPRLSWKATPWWTVSGSYRYRSQDYTASNFGRATSNAVFLTLNYVWPKESLSRWRELQP